MKIDRNKVDMVLAKLGLTDREAATRMGVAYTTFSGLRNGKHELRPKTVYKMAGALRCQIEEIIVEKEVS